ncbi:MAG: DUF4402 domain-containing protein [Rhodospirillales bacterium]|nr:DUF4402 domain-containing protein [Rhodospirillales bacterium]
MAQSIEKKSMKAKAKTATAAGVVALSSLSFYHAMNAVAATATMPIVAKLIRAIEITINTTMDFGTLAMTVDRAGQATLDPETDKLYIASHSSLSLAGGQPQAGRLQIRGSELPVTISVEETAVKLTNGTATVSVTDFNLLTARGGTYVTVTPTSNNPYVTMAVGATINTRVGQLSGSYVGAARIRANYQ